MNVEAPRSKHGATAPVRVTDSEWAVWLLAALTFGVADVVTTSVGLSLGLSELNPIYRTLFAYGPVPVIMSAGFGIQLLLAGWLARRFPYPRRLWVPFALSLLGISGMLRNVSLILGVM